MKLNKKMIAFIAIGFLLLSGTFVNMANACTGIRLIATDGGVVYGRTMEWGAFDWHMTNLRNYVNLSNVAIPDKKIDDLDFTPLGGGSGMIGLPGDFTPPSRFVRAVAWTQTARTTPTTYETVYEVFRILDNFNVPLGAAEGSDEKGDTEKLRSSTLWTSAWDLTDHILYYHTQNNRRVRALDFKEIDFSNLGNNIIHLPLDKVNEQDIEYITLKK